MHPEGEEESIGRWTQRGFSGFRGFSSDIAVPWVLLRRMSINVDQYTSTSVGNQEQLHVGGVYTCIQKPSQGRITRPISMGHYKRALQKGLVK
jgi:hypothetical protein